MRVQLKNNGYTLSADFPAAAFAVQDMLDRLRCAGNSEVTFRFYDLGGDNPPPELCQRDFTADIYKLNLFTERLEQLESPDTAALKSLLKTYPDSGFEDILLMTHGLDSVMVYPCANWEELGETVIENELLPELENCSDEILDMLDRERVGKIMQECDNGAFVDGYYCAPSSYEPPDIHIEIGRPERCFFRLLIAPDGQKTAQSRWISLPCDGETLLGGYDQTCCALQSALPQITMNTLENMHQIGALNALAERLSALSHEDFVKLKAVMESENICEISDTADCIEHLSAYAFDRSVQDCSAFGQAYLAKNLPTNFDISLLESGDFYDFGSQILEQTGGAVTSYGVISGRGQSLYAALTVQPEQRLAEAFSEDESQAFHMELGGMRF